MRRGATGIVVLLALAAAGLAGSAVASADLVVSIQGPTQAQVDAPVEYWAAAESTTRQPGDPPIPYDFAWTVDGVPAPSAPGVPPRLDTAFADMGSHTIAVTVGDGLGNTQTAALTVAATAPPPVIVRPPDIVFAGGEVELGRRSLPIQMRCTVPTGCKGTLEVRTFAVHGDGRRVGLVHFAIQGSATVRVPLSAANRRRLRRGSASSLTLRVRHDGGRSIWAQGAVDFVL